jgi:prepilin-type N-terminal cleavage/methylation domain-containing protein
MRTIKNIKVQEGFTLIELLMTILVGSILIGSFTVLIANHSHLSQRGRDLTVANSYIENKVEEVRSKGYSALNDGTTNLTGELPGELNNPKTGSLQVSSPSVGLKKVTATITYNDQGTAQTYSYTTYVGELGVGQY